MTPTLETKLARIVDHLERQELGSGANKALRDDLGMHYALTDREVSDWLDKHRATGIPLGAILHPRG